MSDFDPDAYRRMLRAANEVMPMPPLKIKRPMDPGLRKLMDNLPKGDPDAQPPERIECWLPFCQVRHVITRGVGQECNFGEWYGPRMPWADVIMHARSLTTGREWKLQPVPLGGSQDAYPGVVVIIRMLLK